MKTMYITLALFLCLFLLGCSSISLNKTQQQELEQYIQYSNNLLQLQLNKDTNKRLRLQPYRTRYRLIEPIIFKIKNNK